MKIMIVIAVVLLLSLLICGLYIGKQEVVEESSIAFHRNLGIASVAFTVLTLVLAFIKIK